MVVCVAHLIGAVRGARGRLTAGRVAISTAVAIVAILALGVTWWLTSRPDATPAPTPRALLEVLGAAVRARDLAAVEALAYQEVIGYRDGAAALVASCGSSDFLTSGARILPDDNVPSAVATVAGTGTCAGTELVLTETDSGSLCVRIG